MTRAVVERRTGTMEQIDLETILTGVDPEPSYLVDGLLCKGQVICFAGDPGVGKSFLLYYVSMSIACGLTVLGRKAVMGKVLYFDEENSRLDLAQYLRWIWRGLGCPAVVPMQENLYIEQFSLSKQGAKRWDYMTRCADDVKPALIVVDTVISCADVQDENDNAEAMAALKRFRKIRDVAGPETTMILLKHAKFTHDPHVKQSIRGAKVWKDQTDGLYFHKLAAGKPRGDGLRNCKLVPDKVRAFGLREQIDIIPSWVGEGKEKGVVLHG